MCISYTEINQLEVSHDFDCTGDLLIESVSSTNYYHYLDVEEIKKLINLLQKAVTKYEHKGL